MKSTLLFYLLASICLVGQVNIESLKSNYVIKENRISFRNSLQAKVEYFSNKSIKSSNLNEWISFFREIELSLFHSSKLDSIIKRSLDYAISSGPKFRRAAIELAHTFNFEYPKNNLIEILRTTNNVQVFGTATHYLLSQNSESSDTTKILELLKSKFPGYANDPILKFLYNDLSKGKKYTLSYEMLIDLLSHPFQKGKTVIYSLHRKDRKHSGITIIKIPDGRFVRNSDSTIFYVQQLAASTSQLPGYLSQGNTPQGVFTVVGTYVSPTESIGPTPNVLTRIPHEVAPSIFYHGKNKSNNWNIEEYKELLPASLQNYLPLHESYYAGMTGRRLIVMHGSTDDISFFEETEYYPLTPSKGCLTTKEIWNENTGRLIESDQVKLMNAFHASGNLYGFLVVVDIDEKVKPVTINELLPIIKEAENLR
jgi:hypothetical protein